MRFLYFFILIVTFNTTVFAAGQKKSGTVKKSFFKSLQINTESSLTAEKETEKSSIKSGTGIRLNCTGLTGIFTASTDRISFLEFQEDGVKVIEKNLKTAWGVQNQLEIKNIGLKTDCLAGSLKFSNAVSRLKTPALTNGAGALQSPVLLMPGTGAALPSFTSSPSPLSFSAGFSFNGSKVPLPQVQAAFCPDQNFFISVTQKLYGAVIPETTLSVTGGFFCHENKGDSSWFQKEKTYRDGPYCAAEMLSCFTFPSFRSSTAFSIFQSPFGLFSGTVRTHNSVLLGNFTLNTAFFSASPSTVSASGKVIHVQKQYRVNPQFYFQISSLWINTGFSFQQDFMETKERVPEPFCRYTKKAAMELEYKGLFLFYNWSSSVSEEDKSISESHKISLSRYIGNCRSTSSVQIKNENQKQDIIFNQSLIPRNSFISGINLSGTFKDLALKDAKFSGDIKFSFSSRKIRYTGKLSLNFTNR